MQTNDTSTHNPNITYAIPIIDLTLFGTLKFMHFFLIFFLVASDEPNVSKILTELLLISFFYLIFF